LTNTDGFKIDGDQNTRACDTVSRIPSAGNVSDLTNDIIDGGCTTGGGINLTIAEKRPVIDTSGFQDL